jgi:topoisomerase-4 subunit B
MARSKAYLFRGVEIRWSCDPDLLKEGDTTPAEAVLSYPNGLADALNELTVEAKTRPAEAFTGRVENAGRRRSRMGCHLVGQRLRRRRRLLALLLQHHPDPRGRHARGRLPLGLTKGLRAYGELTGNKKPADHGRGCHGHTAAPCSPSSSAARNSSARRKRSCPRPTPSAHRERDARPLRPLAHRRAARPPTACCWAIGQRRRPDAPRKDKEVARQSATANCACPASWRTVPTVPRKAPNSSSSKATRPAAQPSRRAIAQRRPSCPCAARS